MEIPGGRCGGRGAPDCSARWGPAAGGSTRRMQAVCPQVPLHCGCRGFVSSQPWGHVCLHSVAALMWTMPAALLGPQAQISPFWWSFRPPIRKGCWNMWVISPVAITGAVLVVGGQTTDLLPPRGRPHAPTRWRPQCPLGSSELFPDTPLLARLVGFRSAEAPGAEQ